MAEVLLFHHAQGQTEGFAAFADELRGAGHTVHTPDFFDGRTFASIDEGMGYVRELGFGEIIDRGERAANELPDELVYAGFSLGVVPAQKLAQTRAGARGALLFYSCVPTSEFGTSWPADVPVQIHGMDADPIFVGEGDLDAARALVESTGNAELFLYPGDQHYFADSSLPSYDAEATALLTRRVLDFLQAADMRDAPSVSEAKLEKTENGLVPAGGGWYVLNMRDAEWRHADGRGAVCVVGDDFEGWRRESDQLGVNPFVLGPAEPMSMYHWEADQEDFLVLSGEATLIVEGEERRLRAWDFVHCPPHTRHVIVGAGSGPCLVIAVGGRAHDGQPDSIGFVADEAAKRHGASVEEDTTDGDAAYASVSPREPTAHRHGWLPDDA